MKITLARSAGFCFGVRRAITIALDTAKKNGNVRMLGDIVHNEEVIASIEKAGVRRIKGLRRNKGELLLIQAHGASIDFINDAKRLGYRIVDATCPKVKNIHDIVRKMEAEGRRIIIIGDKEHDEVKGILGQLKKKGMVIDSTSALPASIKKIKKAAVVVQSTQNEEKVKKILPKLESAVPDLKFFDTICFPTRLKQEEIKSLPRDNDAVIIIGSRRSANTRRLFEISKGINPRTYWVQSAGNIKPSWFKGISSIGITSGASTPDKTTQEVMKLLEKL